MIQFNTTFFIPVGKVDEAVSWLVAEYMPELKSRCGGATLGRLLTAVEEDHIGLTASAVFESECDAEKWDASVGGSLRTRMAQSLGMQQILHFSSMIEIIDA